MTAGVYAIVNTADGRAYIGSSKTIEIRWAGWRSTLSRGRAGNKQLQADWANAEGNGFVFTILEEVSGGDDVLSAAESQWISRYAGRCYNVHINVRRAVPGQVLARLQQVRLAAGFTVRALAAKAKVSPNVIANAELGRMSHGSTMWKLADALGVHRYALVSAEEEKAFHEGQAWLEAKMRRRAAYFAQLAQEHQSKPSRKRRRPRADQEAEDANQ